MTQLKVTQVRSAIGRPQDQKDTVRRLGIHRLHETVIKEDRPEIRGMIAKVQHLVTVEEVAEDKPKRRSTKPKDEAPAEGESA